MIVFIEDQIESADLYLDELEERGLIYHYFRGVDEAWEFLGHGDAAVRVMVIDIMMPNGSLFSEVETSDGLTTGLSFYKRSRQLYPDCWIIALTNLSSAVVAETLSGDEKAEIFRKDEVFYDELADRIEELASKGAAGDGE